MTVTHETIHEAHGSLLQAESLLDILIRADVDLTAGEAATVCNLLLGLVANGAKVLDSLNCGYNIEPGKKAD
jgi:cytosine/adenosine deaminase-related metal-dependent hydrolase